MEQEFGSADELAGGVLLDNNCQSGECKIFVFPPTEINTTDKMRNTVIDINIASIEVNCAVNSDELRREFHQSNSFALFPPGTEYSVEMTSKMHGCVFEIGEAKLKSWAEEVDINEKLLSDHIGYRTDPVAAEIGRASIQYALSSGDANCGLSELTVDAFAIGLVASILKSITRKDVKRTVKNSLWSRPGNDVRLKRAVEFIEANLHDPKLTVSRVARIAGISAAYFSCVFTDSLGINPYKYILKKRLILARDQLVMTRKPIAVIAFETGFSSQPHMTTAIKKYFGNTPRQLRDASVASGAMA